MSSAVDDVSSVHNSGANEALAPTVDLAPTAAGKRPMTAEQAAELAEKRAKLDEEGKAEAEAEKAARALVAKEAAMQEGQISAPECRTTRFTNALTGVTGGVQGILRKKTRARKGKDGRAFRPYAHQRKCVKRALPAKETRMLVCHDPGLGKTMTFLLMVAAMHTLQRGRRRKILLSCPKACVEQHYNAVRDTLLIPKDKIFVSTELKSFTQEAIDEHDFIITTKDLIGNAFGKCHRWETKHHQNARGNWCSAFAAIPGVPLHPLLKTKFDMVCIDEVHLDRNPLCRWTQGHQLISNNTTKVIGMTATPLMNRPLDLVGIATGMDLEPKFKDIKSWFTDKAKKHVNLETIKQLASITDRAKESILNLPPLTDHVVDFDADIDSMYVDDYNEILGKARKLRFSLERRGRATQAEMHKLMSYLQQMQQFLVSPLLAEKGAAAIKSDADLVERASRQDTGAMRALKTQLVQLNNRGFNRIMVAACHVSLLKVAKAYLQRECPSVGNVMIYDGSLSLPKREEMKDSFLEGERTVLLMSIQAGGTGLHLVPGSNAVIFWGSRPYSPQDVIQCKKRVHRIGQEQPVEVYHLIANGSVDYAIDCVHKDKMTLANAVVDNDMSELEAEGGKWRSTGRIVDNCLFLGDDGQFPIDGDLDEGEVAARLSARYESEASSPEHNQAGASGSAAGSAMDLV